MIFDAYLFQYINSFAKKSNTLDFFARFSAVALGPLCIAILALSAIFLRNLDLFIFPIASALFARFLIDEFIYWLYKRKRPMEVLSVNQLIKKPNHPSFPSGHASVFFAISFTILPYSVILGLIFLIISSIVVFFRIFSGLHWPSDIFGGIICGYLAFLVVYFFLIRPLV